MIIFAIVQSDQTVERKQERIRTKIHFKSNLSIFTVSLYMYDCMYVYSILSPFPNQTFFCTPSTHNSFLPTHIDIPFSGIYPGKSRKILEEKSGTVEAARSNLLICFFDKILFCLNQKSISQFCCVCNTFFYFYVNNNLYCAQIFDPRVNPLIPFSSHPLTRN